jgi:hypothetical protein
MLLGVNLNVQAPALSGHGFLVYCKNCQLILGRYPTLAHVPYMLHCSVCGASSRSRFHRSLDRLPDVCVTSAQGDLGRHLVRLCMEGTIRKLH